MSMAAQCGLFRALVVCLKYAAPDSRGGIEAPSGEARLIVAAAWAQCFARDRTLASNVAMKRLPRPKVDTARCAAHRLYPA